MQKYKLPEINYLKQFDALCVKRFKKICIVKIYSTIRTYNHQMPFFSMVIWLNPQVHLFFVRL